MRIIDVDQSNVERHGFFCYMSKKKSIGYQRKLTWLMARFSEGMRIKLLELPDRGFIEYIPGEFAWRAVDAKGYMFIHCLWVVGRSKGKGYATALLDACMRDAKKAKLKGVAMVTSERNWLVGRNLLERHGFECVAEAPPAFSLMVRRFGGGEVPAFVDNRATVRRRFGKGLNVVRSDQCPYIEDATATALAAAEQAGIASRVIDLTSAAEVRQLSPTPYGVFGIMLDGRLISYHYLLHKDLVPLLDR
ncbi:MAG: GNAT family N-acetyltransferase [Gemmatimonadota bacterium]|nr:MAG: GNAT family N-acetyltransferase [Gemmatimonadota bacterium]